MSGPRKCDQQALKRLARYLIGKPRAVYVYEWGHKKTNNELRVQSGSDWAGNRSTRKSTSGGTVRWGKGVLKTWSKDQSVIATSSGEAELYALNRAAAEALGIQSLAKDLGIELSICIEIDALTTMGII